MSVSNDKKFPDEEFVKLFIEEINHLVYRLPICGIITSTDLSEKRSQVYSEIRAEDN